VPYEPLGPGPKGALFEVDPTDGDQRYSMVELDDPRILIKGGVDPSPSNHYFHQQMVYAVSANLYATFRTALGRLIAWGFEGRNGNGTRLRLVPHGAGVGTNALYDKSTGEVRFGYYLAPEGVRGRNLPGAPVYTCMSHDIIVHELTHALIDGLRSHFLVPTGPEVLGFHEGFADLVAVLQHFRHQRVVEEQIAAQRGNIERADALGSIAAQFGLTTSGAPYLRSSVQTGGEVRFSRQADPHSMGTVLVTAVFRAMAAVYRRRIDRYLTLMPRDRPLPETLVRILAEEASKLAGHFQNMCIRAIDYCPPVDLQLGEYLRALITADHDLMPRDEWCYRETLIDAFAEVGIYPSGTKALSEDALLWRAPQRYVGSATGLCFSDLRFDGDPSLPASANELERQARALGEFVTRPENMPEFGIAPPGEPRLKGDRVDPPCIQSIRTSRRVGENGEVLFDLVAEVTQQRFCQDPVTGCSTELLGGSTVILGPRGEVRYVISKCLLRQDRLDRQLAFQRESNLWSQQDGRLTVTDNPLRLVHSTSASTKS
jgi:hypothetical protein